MADVAELFNILRDSATGAGESPVSRIEGEVAAAQEGLIGFSFKDNAGNVVLPQLDASGRIPVTPAAQGPKLSDSTSGTGSVGSPVDVITLVATINEVYAVSTMTGSCARPCLWTLVGIDDVGGADTETALGRFYTGSGDFTHTLSGEDCLGWAAGASGVQNIVLRGQQVSGPASDLHATLCCVQAV